MPPRRPPPPGALTILCTIAALAAAWLTIALDQVARALIGAALGMPWYGLVIDANRGWSVFAVQGGGAAPELSAVAWALMLVAGGVLVPALALAFALLTDAWRASGWIRAFGLTWLVVATLFFPTALAAAVLSGGSGGGPGYELYQRLGEPEAGRWVAVALAAFLAALLTGPLASRAVTVGRAWMRADGLEFRRRLVRVVAGWPAAAATCAVLFGAGWARTPLAVLWVAALLGLLHFRTR